MLCCFYTAPSLVQSRSGAAEAAHAQQQPGSTRGDGDRSAELQAAWQVQGGVCEQDFEYVQYIYSTLNASSSLQRTDLELPRVLKLQEGEKPRNFSRSKVLFPSSFLR